MNKVKIPFLVVALFLFLPIALADSNEVVSGDYLFVRAQVVGCGPTIRIIEYGQVKESGDVTLFGDISLDVKGKVTGEIAAQLVDALEQRNGYRSKTIKIDKIPETDAKKQTIWLMILYQERKHKCKPTRRPPEIYPEWRFDYRMAQDASHNKSLNTDASEAGDG